MLAKWVAAALAGAALTAAAATAAGAAASRFASYIHALRQQSLAAAAAADASPTAQGAPRSARGRPAGAEDERSGGGCLGGKGDISTIIHLWRGLLGGVAFFLLFFSA